MTRKRTQLNSIESITVWGKQIDNTGFRLQVKENQTQREHKNDTIDPTVILLMEYV